MVSPWTSSPLCDQWSNKGYQNAQLRFNFKSDHRDNQPLKREAFRPTSAACLELSEFHAASRKQQTAFNPKQPTQFCPFRNTKHSDLHPNLQWPDKPETACVSGATDRTSPRRPDFHSTLLLSCQNPSCSLRPDLVSFCFYTSSQAVAEGHQSIRKVLPCPDLKSSILDSIHLTHELRLLANMSNVPRPLTCKMSIIADQQHLPAPDDKPCLHPTNETPW